jgi:hypothetical protein
VCSTSYPTNTLNYLIPIRVHTAERLLPQFGQPEVPSRRSVGAGRYVTCDQAIRLQAGQNGVYAAFADLESANPLQGPDHLVTVTAAVPQKVQRNKIEQSLAKLSLPIVQFHLSPLFQGIYKLYLLRLYSIMEY